MGSEWPRASPSWDSTLLPEGLQMSDLPLCLYPIHVTPRPACFIWCPVFSQQQMKLVAESLKEESQEEEKEAT